MPVTTEPTPKYRVGLSALLTRPDGGATFPSYDLSPLEEDPAIELVPLPDVEEFSSEDLRDVDAIISGAERITEASLGPNGRLALVARFGVGFDMIELAACTRHDVAVTITPEGVKRPMAVAILTLLLALAGKLLIKDTIARGGSQSWADRLDHHGQGLVGKSLGSIGVGNIGAELFRLARPFGLNLIASDPYVDASVPKELGVEMVELDELFVRSDFVVVNCPLNDETRHIASRERIGLMKPTSYLINTARGPLVDQVALHDALAGGRIAGAGLDTFDPEPPAANDPLLHLDNVILAPHSLGWTDQMWGGFADTNMSALRAVIRGKAPNNVVNSEVLEKRSFLAKLAALEAR